MYPYPGPAMRQPPPPMGDNTPGGKRCRTGAVVVAIIDLIMSLGAVIAWIAIGVTIGWWGFSIPGGILSLSAIWSLLIIVLKEQRWPSIVFIVWNCLRATVDICIFMAVMIYWAFPALGLPSSGSESDGYPGGSGYPSGGSDYSGGFDPVLPDDRSRSSSSGSGNGLIYYIYALGPTGMTAWAIVTVIMIALYFIFIGFVCGYCLSFGDRRRMGFGYPGGNVMTMTYAAPAPMYQNYAQPPPSYQYPYQAPGAPGQPAPGYAY